MKSSNSSSLPPALSTVKKRTWERRLDEAKLKHRPKLRDWKKDGFSTRRRNDFKIPGENFSDQVRNVLTCPESECNTGDSRERDANEKKKQRREKDKLPSEDLGCGRNLDRNKLGAAADVLEESNNRRHTANRSSSGELREIDRISCKNVNPAQFIEHYEKRRLPCIISDIPRIEKWAAEQSWNFSSLNPSANTDNIGNGETDNDKGDLSDNSSLKNHHDTMTSLRNNFFKVGEDDDGIKVKVKLKYFLRYVEMNRDDSPLYIFDSNFADNKVTDRILKDYSVPSYFPEDLFSLVGEKRRPPYRWFLVGPERSGSTIHIDPLGTSAWNTLLSGRKRWVLFPPDTPKATAKGLNEILKGEDDEAVNYFVDILPRIQAKHPTLPIIQFIQKPGDTVFVPGGWWHAVLNLDNTIAVTQNYCSSANFDWVWVRTRDSRKKMSSRWLRALKRDYPVLAASAIRLNERDNYVMLEDREKMKEIEREKEKEKEREEKDGEKGGVRDSADGKKNKIDGKKKKRKERDRVAE